MMLGWADEDEAISEIVLLPYEEWTPELLFTFFTQFPRFSPTFDENGNIDGFEDSPLVEYEERLERHRNS